MKEQLCCVKGGGLWGEEGRIRRKREKMKKERKVG